MTATPRRPVFHQSRDFNQVVFGNGSTRPSTPVLSSSEKRFNNLKAILLTVLVFSCFGLYVQSSHRAVTAALEEASSARVVHVLGRPAKIYDSDESSSLYEVYAHDNDTAQTRFNTGKKNPKTSILSKDVEELIWSGSKNKRQIEANCDKQQSIPLLKPGFIRKSGIAEDGQVCKLKYGINEEGKIAPIPVILVTLGRSGSSSIWQVIGTLTGEETPSEEYTGSDVALSCAFFDTVVPENDDGAWAREHLCQKQIQNPDAGVVGFKWKPFKETFFSDKSLAALRMIAGSHNPQIKIVRSKRNGLDRTLSIYKHRKNDPPAHCMVGDQACIKAHIKAAQGLKVPVEDMMMRLEQEYEDELMVDRVLLELAVPHVYVSFDELFHGDNIAKEWARIFEFLGVGPKEDSLTTEMVEKAMMHAATNSLYHNETIENYEEVRDALMGTKFENLLH